LVVVVRMAIGNGASAGALAKGNLQERAKARKHSLYLSAALAVIPAALLIAGTANADEPAKGPPSKVTPAAESPTPATDVDEAPPPPAEPPPEPQAEAAGDDNGNDRVEKVVVTATRRETVLQKTPIAITAVGKKSLEAARVENIEDLVPLVPSLQVTNNGNPTGYTARIRGVGTQGDNPGLEAAVGTFIDGVYRNRASVAMGDLGELERVEVLRGPQGTLFGRNTSAGILSIITKKPSLTADEFMAEATVGSFEQLVGKGMANFVLAEDEFALRFFGTRHQQEGYIDVNPGRPDAYDGNSKDYYNLKGQALWQATPNAEIRIVVDYAERQDDCCSAATVFPGGFGRAPTAAFPDTSAPAIINTIEAPLPGKSTTNEVEDQVGFGNRPTNSDTEDKGVSAELNWNLSGAKLTSITALRDWRTAYGQDPDFSGADIIYIPGDGSNFNEFETFTHESRITGEAGWVNWLFGVYYADEDLTRNSKINFGTEQEAFFSLHRIGDLTGSFRGALNSLFAHNLAIPVFTGDLGGDNDHYEQNAESFALFTHNVFHLDETLDFIAGLRWTTETKTFDASYNTTGNGGCESIEALYGLDPITNVRFNHPALAPSLDATRRGLANLACLPQARSALDGLAHHQERTEDEFSGVATLAWELASNLNTYATYSRGHKAGGFNLDRAFSDAAGSIISNPTFAVPGAIPVQIVRAPDTSFAAEFVDAYEIGLKTSFDDSFFVNTAVFYQEFENFQLNTFTGISFIVTSVPEVISQGVEVETFWQTPVRGLTTNFAAQYTDAHYGDVGSLTDPTSFLGRNPGLFLLDNEAQLTHAPEWTLTGALDYSTPFIETFTARFHLDARWQSEMNTGSNLDPRKIQEAFAVVGLNFGVYGEGEWIGLEIFARNLFDERYINTAIDSPFQGSSVSPTSAATSTVDAFLGEPRMIGATLRIKH
jgi:iron complex outermembrane receptor protein